MEIVYHGTTSNVSPLIEMSGLLPDVPKIYSASTDPDAASNVSFGGVYVSRKRSIAEQAANYAVVVCGGRPVVYSVCMDVDSSDVYLDEDEIIRMVEDLTDTFSWEDMHYHQESIFFELLQDCERFEGYSYFKNAFTSITSNDFSYLAEKLIREIRPDIDRELLEDMLESVANLLTLFGVHLLGVQFLRTNKGEDLPRFLETHFDDLVRSVDLFSEFFPETKFLKDWDTFRIMSPVGYGSVMNKHWIVSMDYERIKL
jgi:hypothetical protein